MSAILKVLLLQTSQSGQGGPFKHESTVLSSFIRKSD